MLRNLFIGAVIACMFVGVAFAQDAVTTPEGVNAYGYTFDDVAVNQGVVLYWYAHGYANCYGGFPESFAAMVEKGMPLRTFVSPFTGDAIDPDDGSLDFDGDMIYVPGECWDVEVHVQTTAGVVKLPTVLSATSDILVQFDPCCAPCYLCGDCCDITICCYDCWKIDPCDPNDAICKITQWMMWKSFELHDCLYDTRPVNELAWIASGLAPVDQNYKEYVPTMDIEYIYKGDCCCQILKKAYVHCCTPCDPCCKPKCDPCNKCKQDTCTTCKPKCDPCKPKCDPCKPKCEPCKPKCDPCKPKCEPCKPKCDPCKPKCDPCKPKCDPCKPKCDPCKKCSQDTCTTCKPKCEPCKPKCDPCKKCSQDTCTPKDKCSC